MEDHIKVQFAKRLEYGVKADDLPKRYVEVYDLMGKRWQAMLSNKEPRRDEWPLITVMADLLYEANGKIAALEARCTQLEGDKRMTPPASAVLDMRTKEGRALKTQMAGVP